MHDRLLDEALGALDSDDDEALRVYADWLAEQGAPRGELIQLQLLPETPETWKRQKQLLREHGEAWLDDAAPMLTRVTWRHGFPYEATLSYALPRRPRVLETLRILHCKRGDRHHREQTHALLVHPVLHGLHHVDGPVAIETIEHWAADRPRPLRHLEVPPAMLQLEPGLRGLLEAGEGLASLRSLARKAPSHPRQWRHLMRTRIGKQIERLQARSQVAALAPWLSAYPDKTLVLTLANATLRLERERDRLAVEASLGRIYDGGTSVPTAALLARVLAVLPARRFDTLEVHWPRAYTPTDHDRTALAAQINRLRR